MDKAPQIINGSSAELDQMAAILADSFSTDPVMNWVLPATDIYPGFFRLITRDIFLPKGLCHVETADRGAGLWLPPGEKFDLKPGPGLIGLMLKLILKSSLAPLRRIPQQAAVFDRHHPEAPHYHLLFVGARHANQGQGVGSALIKEGLRTVDKAGMPAYLESSNERNVPLYERHGFEVVSEDNMPGGGPPVWFMWREARQAPPTR
ncbi:GNAT family N-acetyltransferase [Halioglobus maricola]|uniref:GNAT family N-acetyltransferase n=1 Tax=Halioglobus maricola TaxID=2601894 RepID=A0A5P9NFI9_9GAMM|nr:GNAT family N-acetyltransferase [Halioglobus maricola]QFU74550.1 GNAT family N-acetyltransferase [Halioglobus maricola]